MRKLVEQKKKKLSKDFGKEIFPGCYACGDPRDAGYLSEEEMRRMHWPEDLIKKFLEIDKCERRNDND